MNTNQLKLKEYYKKLEMLDWMDDLLTKRMKFCNKEIKKIYLEAIEENKNIRKELKNKLKG